MRETELRSVLLVKAIEETPGAELLIPEADRKTAAREARRDAGEGESELKAGAALPGRAQRMLAARARVLAAPVIARHPFIESVLDAASGPAWLTWALVLLSVLCGGALSALDGPRRIDIVSLPLLALVAWNLIVYIAVVVTRVSPSMNARPRGRWLPAIAAGWILRNVRRFVDKSSKFNAPLAEALGRFTREWSEVAKPLLLARASRVFHLCAAAAGAGLIAGLYLRGVTLDYSAGWESTFIGASGVHTFASIVYGPASAMTGIAIPDVARIEAIRWQIGGAGGERAATWIHLLAATVMLYIVLPRLLLVLITTLSVWRLSFRAPLPASLAAYFRTVFGGEGVLGPTTVTVFPYAYEPSAAATTELRRLLAAALGEHGTVEVRSAVPYGDEEAVSANAGETRDGVTGVTVLLLNLAGTPEEDNHGAVVSALRRRAGARGAAKLLVVLDEGPYAARMAAVGGAAERLAERRRLWEQFLESHGTKAYFANLAAPVDLGDPPMVTLTEAERLRNALLQPGAA